MSALPTVTCYFTMDNYVYGVYLGNAALSTTGDWNDWSSTKSVTFTPDGNYLTITGYDHEGTMCTTGGFAIDCTNGVNGNSGWHGYDSSSWMDSDHMRGSGSGWFYPSGSASGFYLPYNSGSPKIGVCSQHGAYRYNFGGTTHNPLHEQQKNIPTVRPHMIIYLV